MTENNALDGWLAQKFSPTDRAKAEKTLPKWLKELRIESLEWGIVDLDKNDSATHIYKGVSEAPAATLLANLTISNLNSSLFWQFVFYRMNQNKDLLPDVEILGILQAIDRTSSGGFANDLLKTYCVNGADTKQKWVLVLSALLGDGETVDFLKKKISEWADSQRGKMAENAVKALALNGSKRAWLAIDFCSRKYKTKNKNIGASAAEAFKIAAEALNISPHELADSLIPDLGFEGVFLPFEANGEPYRAFINSDFKLAFLSDDGWTLKTPPKGTAGKLKDDFKAMAKDIREVVKSQTPRLEQFLVNQRRWLVEKWSALFLENPVMFAYANRLIWGIFDENGNLTQVFRVQEDQTLSNSDYDELDLSDFTEGGKIGLVHPLSLTSEQIDFWKNALLEADLSPIFPQLDRKTFVLEEKDRFVRLSPAFKGLEISGYTCISRMDKMGWQKGSVIEGGTIASYYKDLAEFNLIAIVRQGGGLSVGYYEANAELGDLMFVRRGSVGFGSYSYDEPTRESDQRLLPLDDVPPIVFSEVMADLNSFRS